MLHNSRLPVASSLNATWMASSRSKKGATEVTKHALDDDAAMSTRPSFALSPNRFDREAANAKLVKATKRNPLRKNDVG